MHPEPHQCTLSMCIFHQAGKMPYTGMAMEWKSADNNEWKLKYLFMQEADSGDGPSTRCTRLSSQNAPGRNRRQKADRNERIRVSEQKTVRGEAQPT